MANGEPANGELAMREMKERLRRVRKRRRAAEQSVLDKGEPVKHHDVLVVAPAQVHGEQEIFRVPVVKIEGQVNQGELDHGDAPLGNYVDMPEKLDFYDYAQRRTVAIARPQDWGPPERRHVQRGPAFGTLPVKREPAATSCAACYLIDAQNLTFENAWIAEEWNDFGSDDREAAPSADDPSFKMLIAGPRGKVFRLEVNLVDGGDDLWPVGEQRPIGDDATFGSVESLDLRYEMEIWNQLRNGCVAGRVLTRREAEVIPLVNVTTLIPPEMSSPTVVQNGG
jgi:hypothetical protein